MLIRTPAGESRLRGRHAFSLLERLRPHLDGRTPLDELLSGLGAEQALAVSRLVEHLVRIGAADDGPPGPDPAPPRPARPAGRRRDLEGSGLLHEALLGHPLLPAAAAGGRAVIVAHDAPDRRRDRRLHERFCRSGRAWLPVTADVDEVWVGPRSGDWTGCSTCLRLRLRAAHADGYARERIARRLAGRAPASSRLRSPELARSVLEVVLRWNRAGPAAVRAVVRLPVAGGPPAPSWLLPVPGCPACGRLDVPPDPWPVPAAPGARREPGLRAAGARLSRLSLDRRTGLVCAAGHHPDESLPGVPLARALVPSQDLVRGRRAVAEWAHGSGETPEEATAVAMLEAVERYAASLPRGLRLESARARDLGPRALDPAGLVLHAAEQYRQPGFAWEPFDPAAARRWTWAWSTGRRRRLAVPADLVFHRLRRASAPGEPPVRPAAYGTSSGCATGGGPVEAALRALLEVLERDALLVAWYRGAPLPRLDLDAAHDPRIHRLRSILRREGYDCVVLDTSLAEHGVASAWALVVNVRDSRFKAISGACAHPAPEAAVLGAIREAASHLRLTRELYESRRRRALRLLADPTLVRRPVDHALTYGCPEAFWLLEALIGPCSPGGFEGPPGRRPVPSTPPSEQLAALCSRLAGSGFDVLFADVTPADARALGLTVVRALVPGTLPLTFGHGRERLAGTRRARLDPGRPWPHPLA